MPDARIDFAGPADLFTVGRNGLSYAHGLAVEDYGAEVALRPINSRGDLTVARVVCPVAALPDLIAALSAILEGRA